MTTKLLSGGMRRSARVMPTVNVPILAARPDRTLLPSSDVVVGGRRLSPGPVFDAYWRFAAARQAVYLARLDGQSGPWTADPIVAGHRFTNCFRAADRASQFLISEVGYTGDQDPAEVVFRVLLFKLFNRVSTWDLLVSELGAPSWASFDVAAYEAVLDRASAAGSRLYSAAYVIPPPALGAVRKHANHLRLLRMMMASNVADRLAAAPDLRTVFEVLRAFPSIGDFLAFQFAVDLNYTTAVDFDEMSHVVPGPGARDGIRKCFGRAADGIESEVIRYVADNQETHFARLGLSFPGLFGRRLQLVDCQNLFCEVDKYARVAHPEVAGISGRTRIKQSFTASGKPLTARFPPKWGLGPTLSAGPGLGEAGPDYATTAVTTRAACTANATR